MIYLDCAATSLQKPQGVAAASFRAINCLASPGRGSHHPAMNAADCVLNCRLLLAEYFNVDDPDKVIFTINATHALNIAIASLVNEGDKVVISGYEHNAVVRPLTAYGADIVVARSPLFDTVAVVEAYRKALPGAKCAVINHVSNVFGFILPIEEISVLCHEFEVPLIIDVSQSAGIIPIDFAALDAEFIAMPGHKGLLGPQGTGVLLCNHPAKPVLFGGTGSNSLFSAMPEYLPDRLEAGTHNVAGIAGLFSGLNYLKSKPAGYMLEHERALRVCFERQICDINRLTLYSSRYPNCQSGVLSVVSEKPACDELAEILGGMNICVRSGLHCAPTAHNSAGTTETGTVRFSFSPFNTFTDVFQTAEALKKIFINR